MSAAPFSSELKVILALTALFIGWVFAAMVPKNNPPNSLEKGSTLGGVLAPAGDVPCLDGNGGFGFLPKRADTDSFYAQAASMLLGRRLDAVSDSGGAAVAFSGPGAKTDAFASTLYIPKNTRLAGSPAQYRDLWSRRAPAANRSPNTESALTGQNDASTAQNDQQTAENASPDPLLAAVAPNSSADFNQNSPEKAVFDQNAAAEPVTTDTTEPAGFTQEDLLDDRQKGPTALCWKKELEVTEIEGPEFSSDAMPDWSDAFALNGTKTENTPDDPLALEAQKAQNEGLLADSTKVARPMNHSGDTATDAANDAIVPVEHRQALNAPASEGITTADAVENHQNSNSTDRAAAPSSRTGTLVVRKKPSVRRVPAPTPVTIYTAHGDESASDLIEKFGVNERLRPYFYELNKEKIAAGPIAAGSEILIPQVR